MGFINCTMTNNGLDACLQLVADRHRRRAIQHLRHEASGTTTIDDLVDPLRNGGSVTDGPTTDREQLTTQFYHAHLPKLADFGVVEFDPESRAVRYQPDERIETVLDSLPDEPSMAHP